MGIIELCCALIAIGDIWYMIAMCGIYIQPLVTFIILIISVVGFLISDKLSS
jgi:hypothetical protein